MVPGAEVNQAAPISVPQVLLITNSDKGFVHYLLELMTLRIKRLGGTQAEPFTLEVASQLAAASPLLWYLAARLPGLRVVAKKSWAITDDFEAYFLYKDRLFIMETPYVNVWISLLGQPPDESLFAELEAEVQNYGFFSSLFAPFAWVRYLFLPANPPRELLQEYGALTDEQSERGRMGGA